MSHSCSFKHAAVTCTYDDSILFTIYMAASVSTSLLWTKFFTQYSSTTRMYANGNENYHVGVSTDSR